MDACLLDVLHDAGDDDFLAVCDRVDVDLDREIQEAVEQDRAVVRDAHGPLDVIAQLVLAVHDLHRTSAEHVRRPHDQRIADLLRHRDGFVDVTRGAVRRLLELELVDELLEPLAILGEIDRVRRRADHRDARLLERARELQRRLAAVRSRSRPSASPCGRSRARPRASRARNTGDPTCRSRSTPSRGCS